MFDRSGFDLRRLLGAVVGTIEAALQIRELPHCGQFAGAILRAMRSHRLAAFFCVITTAMTGCSAAGDAVGTVTVNLTGRGESGAIYRLREAVITVEGPTSHTWNTEDDPGRTSLSADVDVGDYTALLRDGWHIERVDSSGATAVTAALLSSNPTAFTVTALHRTSVPLQFRVDGDAVDLSQGYDITIGVQETPLLAIANLSGRLPANLAILPANASGSAPPRRAITGLSTQLSSPSGIAVASGELIVANDVPSAINFYPVSADGNTVPIRQITGVASPSQLHIFEAEIYVGTKGNIAVFPLGASGNAAPARVLENVDMSEFAIDQGELYATSSSGARQGIAVYPATATGTATPTRTILPPVPFPCLLGIALRSGLIYAADPCNASVFVLPQSESGTVAPVRVISGPNTGLIAPTLVAIFGAELYVVDAGDSANPGSSPSVRIYPVEASGDVPPRRTISGTAIAFPTALTVF